MIRAIPRNKQLHFATIGYIMSIHNFITRDFYVAGGKRKKRRDSVLPNPHVEQEFHTVKTIE